MQLFSSQNHLPQLSIDCVIFGYHQKELKVLISKIRVSDDIYSLPSGFIKKLESFDEAAKRVVKERTGISNIYLEHFNNFSNSNRSNRQLYNLAQKELKKNIHQLPSEETNLDWLLERFVSIAYFALIDFNKYSPTPAFFDHSLKWYSIKEIPSLMLDHSEILSSALFSLKGNLNSNRILMNLLPPTFTMRELQDLFETVFNEFYDRANFQKKILALNILKRIDKKFTGANNKAPYLYQLIIN